MAGVFACGVLITLWQLGATGLVDETPPLFAAAGRAMAETGDWLTPASTACLVTTNPRSCTGSWVSATTCRVS